MLLYNFSSINSDCWNHDIFWDETTQPDKYYRLEQNSSKKVSYCKSISMVCYLLVSGFKGIKYLISNSFISLNLFCQGSEIICREKTINPYSVHWHRIYLHLLYYIFGLRSYPLVNLTLRIRWNWRLISFSFEKHYNWIDFFGGDYSMPLHSLCFLLYSCRERSSWFKGWKPFNLRHKDRSWCFDATLGSLLIDDL